MNDRTRAEHTRLSAASRACSALLLASLSLLSPAGAQTPAGKTIPVGISSIESGSAAIYRDYGQGFNHYLQYRNSTGGVASYKFDTEILDNQVTPAGGAQTVRQFLASRKFLIMVIGSPAANGAFGILESSGRGVPVISMAATDVIKKLRAAGKLSNIYGVLPNNDRGSMFDLQYLVKDLGQKNIGLVYEDSAVGQLAGELVPPFGSALGATVHPIAVAPTSTNLAPVAARLKATGATAVDVVARVSILAALQKASAAIGYKPVWMTNAANFTTSYIDIAGDAAEGTYFSTFLEPLSSSSSAVTTFKQQVGKIDPKQVNELTQLGWAMGEVVATAIEKSTDNGKKPLTQAGFMDALAGFSGSKVGMILQVGYTEPDHSTIASSLSVYQVKGGKFEKAKDPGPVPDGKPSQPQGPAKSAAK